MRRAATSDLFLGTVYGAGLSLAIWTLALDLPDRGPAAAGVCLGAILAGLVPQRLRRLGRLDVLHAVALAGALVDGPGLSAVAVGLAGYARRLAAGPSGGRHPIATWSFRLASGSAAAACAAGAAALVTGGTRDVRFVAIHLAVFVACRTSIMRGAMWWCARRRRKPFDPATRLRRTAAWLLGTAGGCGLAALAVHTPRVDLLGWIAALAAIATVARGARRTARLRRSAQRSRFALRRQAAKTLACGGAARGAGVARARRLERTALGVAQRMELDDTLCDALGCAALLDHARSNRDTRRRPFEIDEAVFPHPVSTIVRSVNERWDGMGPRGTRARRIHVGARILSAVTAWSAWRDETDADEAIGRVLDESGRRFDPLVVDALIDHVDANNDGDVDDGPRLELVSTPTCATPSEPVVRTLEWAGRELDAFYEIARAARAGLDIESTLTLAAARLTTLVPHATIVVYRLDDRRLRPIFTAGSSAAALRGVSIRLGERLSGRCALDRTARIGESGHGVDSEHDLASVPTADREQLEAALAAPMVVGERVVGVLGLYDRPQRRFGAEDRRRISRVAACLAEAVAHAELAPHPDREGPAITDPLTGLPSAAFLGSAIGDRIHRGEPFGLLGIRLRGVEQLAARHGAPVADRVVSTAAGRIGHARRTSDTAVRLGDDLFVLLTNSPGIDELLAHGSRVTRALRGLVNEAGVSGVRVRPVVAHACWPADGTSCEALLEALDGRLADAVERGRGVVTFPARTTRADRDSAVGSN